MANYIFRRILSMIPTLLIVAVIVFLITRMIPGNPAAVMLGPQAGVDEVEKLTEQLGLNDPLYKQFIDYIGGLLQGDFGNSLSYHQPIVNLILEQPSDEVNELTTSEGCCKVISVIRFPIINRSSI